MGTRIIGGPTTNLEAALDAERQAIEAGLCWIEAAAAAAASTVQLKQLEGRAGVAEAELRGAIGAVAERDRALGDELYREANAGHLKMAAGDNKYLKRVHSAFATLQTARREARGQGYQQQQADVLLRNQRYGHLLRALDTLREPVAGRYRQAIAQALGGDFDGVRQRFEAWRAELS